MRANPTVELPHRLAVCRLDWQISGKPQLGPRGMKQTGDVPRLSCWFVVEPPAGIEPATPSLPSMRGWFTPPCSAHVTRQLLAAVALDVQALAQHRQNPLGDFKPRGGQQVLEELREVNELVTAKATPQEAEAFRAWLLAVAQAAADAGKEGGFLGFGAERVSAGEQRMLEQVRAALGIA
jgi:hypothetical protein